MCLYIFLLVSCSHWCILTSVEFMGCRYGVYTYRRGACVARFDLQGNSQGPQNVKRATVQGFTLFLCPYCKFDC